MKKAPYILLMLFTWLFFSGCDQFFPNRATKTDSKPKYQLNEVGDTVRFFYNENGKLISKVIYQNGEKQGLALNYYENGNVQLEIQYKNGVKDGLTVYNYESGRIYRKTTYDNGVIAGIQKKYYENGNLMAEIPYVDGQVVEGLKEYTREGKLKRKYPHIVFQTDDNLAFENIFTLKVQLSNKKKSVEYFHYIIFKGEKTKVFTETNNGIGMINYFLSKGTFQMKKWKFMRNFRPTSGTQR